jgi:hypothetical protein
MALEPCVLRKAIHMRIFVTVAAAAALSSAVILASSASFAKGHDQGFGAGLAGPATAGMVDDGQSNREGDGSATSYGKTDASLEAKAGEQDNSEVARDRDNPGHPSNK